MLSRRGRDRMAARCFVRWPSPEVVDMESEPGSGSASEAVEAPVVRRRTGVPTSGLGAQHQPRRYATVVPSESFDVPFKPGEVLGGKYRILQLLGVGGV